MIVNGRVKGYIQGEIDAEIKVPLPSAIPIEATVASDAICPIRKPAPVRIVPEVKLTDLYNTLHDAQLQLQGEDYSRLVLTVSVPTEGDEAYTAMDDIRNICAKY